MLNRERIQSSLALIGEISENSGGLMLEEIQFLTELVNDNRYKVAVIGEFSSGKSTFLNALIGTELLYNSDSEATGVITYIESSGEKTAYVSLKNGEKQEIDLEARERYESLKDFLDLNNGHLEVDWVGIKYPMVNIDKGVTFIDTPGLEGISEAQMLTTKSILKEANAVIMLINEKGLSDTELQILSGNYKGFGKKRSEKARTIFREIRCH